jgi:hypothetical protein
VLLAEAGESLGDDRRFLFVAAGSRISLLQSEVSEEASFDGKVVRGLLGLGVEGKGFEKSLDVRKDLPGIIHPPVGHLTGRDHPAGAKERKVEAFARLLAGRLEGGRDLRIMDLPAERLHLFPPSPPGTLEEEAEQAPGRGLTEQFLEARTGKSRSLRHFFASTTIGTQPVRILRAPASWWVPSHTAKAT